MAKTENPLKQLEHLGQSVWLDYIQRSLLSSDKFKHMLSDDGLKGMTSNPTIFEKAIGGSSDYDGQLDELVGQGKDVEEIYETLSIADIQHAADALRPVYDATGCVDGYVSYEVSPLLANDTDGTMAAARRYFSMIDRPNVMIKVPSTPAGLPAIEQLLYEGLNINITLMFSMKHYDNVVEAYIRAMGRRLKDGKPLDKIASVASFFVSRVESLVDKKLDEMERAGGDGAAQLKGKAAVANTRLVYQRFKEVFGDERFAMLKEKGAHVQRPLWASTSTKNPAYSDIKYVEELIGPHTVNTMPPDTMDAFRDHGNPTVRIEQDIDDARADVERLRSTGVDLLDVGEELQDQGVKAFAKSFEDLHATIKRRRDEMLSGAGAR